MARKRKPSQPQNVERLAPELAVDLLRKQLERAQALPDGDTDAAYSWAAMTREVLERAFGASSGVVSRFSSAGPAFMVAGGRNPGRQRAEDKKRFDAKLLTLEGAIALLQDELDLRAPSPSGARPPEAHFEGNRVFIVHGHDEVVQQRVARLVEKLGFQAVILAEQPAEGQTLIEKFESYGRAAAFAVAILTPDDIGGVKGSGSEDLSPRARQNVIFELGFFVGILGRARTVALYEAGVELPSDYSGVEWIPLTSGWDLRVAKEMRTAGLDVDLNLI